MAETILWITRLSALATTLLGLLSVFVYYKAYKKFSAGQFKRTVGLFAIVLLIAVIGVSFMTIYHLAESEIAENLWYVFLFLALIVSCYGSFMTAKFGKNIRP